jgi:hypothetical protein
MTTASPAFAAAIAYFNSAAFDATRSSAPAGSASQTAIPRVSVAVRLTT